jgi:hypothetical protein
LREVETHPMSITGAGSTSTLGLPGESGARARLTSYQCRLWRPIVRGQVALPLVYLLGMRSKTPSVRILRLISCLPAFSLPYGLHVLKDCVFLSNRALVLRHNAVPRAHVGLRLRFWRRKGSKPAAFALCPFNSITLPWLSASSSRSRCWISPN